MRSLLFLFVTLLLPAAASAEDERTYTAGQVWEFQTEDVASDALLIIQQIDRAEETGFASDIFHISLVAKLTDGPQDELHIKHLPVSRATLDGAVTRLSDTRLIFAEWEEGWALWKAQGGGVFTVSLNEIIAMLRGAD
jgi:hypothetical protein